MSQQHVVSRIAALMMVFCGIVFGQSSPNPSLNSSVHFVQTDPTDGNSCNSRADYITINVSNTSQKGNLYLCANNGSTYTWTSLQQPKLYGGGFGSPGGPALSTGDIQYFVVPKSCTINSYNILVDAGTATVKFWKVATGTALPTSSNSINTSGVSISTGTTLHSTTLTDFTTTSVTAHDIGAVTLTAVLGAGYVQATFECK